MRLLQLIDLYFHICKVYENQLINSCFRHTKNGKQPLFTDQEVLTCYLFGLAWEKQLTVKAIHNCMERHYLDWFPLLPGYKAFNNRLNRLSGCLPDLLGHTLSQWKQDRQAVLTSQLLTDSFPVVLAGNNRHAKVAGGLSNKGYCAVKRLFYSGVKVHITAWEQAGTLPIPEFITITPASVHDYKAQQHVYQQIKHLTLIGDKAYHTNQLEKDFLQSGGQLLVAPKEAPKTPQQLKYFDRAHKKILGNAISRVRQPIETIFSWLKSHTNIQDASKVRSEKGLLVHIFGRIAATILKCKILKRV